MADATSIVLLGASNVQMGRSALIAEALRAAGSGPAAEVYVAAGHGRSYGEWSRAFARGLPGIAACGLWRALSKRGGSGGYALLADIGNDLAYGASPAKLAGWVTTCMERLRERDLRVVLSLFPEESVAGLGSWRFWLVGSVLFPGHRFSRRQILEHGGELNERLRAAADRLGCTWVRPESAWYGHDGIHFRLVARRQAWRSLVTHWRLAAESAGADAEDRVALAGARPELCTILGRERRAAQPCVALDGGGRVSIF